LAESCHQRRPEMELVHLATPADPAGDVLDLDTLMETETAIACNPNRDQNIPVLIAYTSGTTGTPRGAVFTQDALTFTAINSNNAWNMRGRDNVLTYLPMFHVGGLLIHTLPALHIGACVTIHEEFDPTSVLAEIGTNGVSLILAPPTFSKALTSHPDWASTDLTGLRCVGIGSTFVPPEVMQPWFDRRVPTQQNYGLTEGVPILASPWEHARRKSRSAGTSMLYTQARVMDDRLNRVAPGMNGEIMLRGRSLFSGYWNNPEATEAAFVDGWFRTGDVGYADEEGYFYIVDRIKNIVIVGSSNVYPADLEKVLDDCPEIAESAVVGCPDPDTGEALVACVKPRELGGLSEQEVRSLFVGRLAEYQHPKHVLFLDAFPRTSLGKVQKAELSRLVRDMLVQEPSRPERETPPQAPLGAAP
ncbi:MAG: class I adenylate-forming enzyme family protein, partial [Ilumatobacteraceae bacterium]